MVLFNFDLSYEYLQLLYLRRHKMLTAGVRDCFNYQFIIPVCFTPPLNDLKLF